MNNTQAIQMLEESMAHRTRLLGSHAPAGDRVAAFMELSSQIHSNPELATQFAALRNEHRQWEGLNGMKEIDMNQFLDNFDDLDEELFGSPEEVEKLKNSPAYHAFRYVDTSGESANPDDYDEKWFEASRAAIYRRAVLTALEEKGGSAPLDQVISRVEQLLGDNLTSHDYEPTTKNPKWPRWETSTRFARLDLILLGWMKADSPRKLWEITPEGRQARLNGDLSIAVPKVKGGLHE
jgi:hypothetical protein